MVALKLGAALAPGLIAADVWSTSIVPVLVAALSSGVIVSAFRLRTDNSKTRADREEILDRRQTEFLAEAEVRLDESRRRLDEMARELDTVKAESQRRQATIAERELRNDLLEREVMRLHDEVAALRRQVALGGRRATDTP